MAARAKAIEAASAQLRMDAVLLANANKRQVCCMYQIFSAMYQPRYDAARSGSLYLTHHVTRHRKYFK